MAGRANARTSVRDALAKLRGNKLPFFLAIFLVMCCGATKKLQTFPMPWIAGQSKCIKQVSSLPNGATASPYNTVGKSYEPISWLEKKADCKEKAKVFLFVTESFTITTAYLIFFGAVKAVFNFVTGVCCDRFGRKWTLLAGWVLGIPMPFMVLYAESWWTAATSNLFLGMQQALVWSATIFIMIDCLGQSNAGIAIGLNETIGYTTIAIITQLAAMLMDEDDPRGLVYYVVLGLICAGILVGLLLRETKPIAVREEAELTDRSDEAVSKAATSSLVWPSGRSSTLSIAQSAFVYTSFVNKSLMAICFAGLMINFLSGFAWGLFAKWMKNDYVVDGQLQWEGLAKETVANITLCYGIPKGVLQWIFGFAGDRVGRKWLIVFGLSVCTVGLIILAVSGKMFGDPTVGFFVGALLLGTGTGIMYTNNLAAVIDHSDPSWRSSALGAYRFWRDMGYAVGALLTGLFADAIGIFGSVILTAALTATAAASVGILYAEATPPREASAAKGEAKAAQEAD